MGLMVSQLGNVVQSSVDISGRGVAGASRFLAPCSRLLAFGYWVAHGSYIDPPATQWPRTAY